MIRTIILFCLCMCAVTNRGVGLGGGDEQLDGASVTLYDGSRTGSGTSAATSENSHPNQRTNGRTNKWQKLGFLTNRSPSWSEAKGRGGGEGEEQRREGVGGREAGSEGKVETRRAARARISCVSIIRCCLCGSLPFSSSFNLYHYYCPYYPRFPLRFLRRFFSQI